ncbi:unnamed protein product, partial [Prorocentrum cordatum]
GRGAACLGGGGAPLLRIAGAARGASRRSAARGSPWAAAPPRGASGGAAWREEGGAPRGQMSQAEPEPSTERPAKRSCAGRAGPAGAPAADAIVVPGGGLTEEGAPAPWVRERLRRAKALYDAARASGGAPAGGPVIVTLSAGTPHKPFPRDERSGYQVLEAEASARYLVRELGVPPEDVLEENLSLDTIGNAYFLRVMHTDVVGLRRLAVVTNAFHMPRTKAIFEAVFSLSGPGQAGASGYDLSFDEVPDTGVEAEALATRRAREMASLEGFRVNAAGWGRADSCSSSTERTRRSACSQRGSLSARR